MLRNSGYSILDERFGLLASVKRHWSGTKCQFPDNTPRPPIDVPNRVFELYRIRTNFTFNIPTLALGRPD